MVNCGFIHPQQGLRLPLNRRLNGAAGAGGAWTTRTARAVPHGNECETDARLTTFDDRLQRQVLSCLTVGGEADAAAVLIGK